MQVYFLLSAFILAICLLTNNVKADPTLSSCDPSVNGGACSSQSYCQCLTLVSGAGNVCSGQEDCASAKPCDVNGGCAKAGAVCVVDPRCGNQKLCYPETLTTANVCPPFASAD